MPLYINGKRQGDGGASEPLVFEVFGEAMSATIPHGLGRRAMVTYYNRDDEEVEVGVSHIDENTLTVSSVQFLNGYIIVA